MAFSIPLQRAARIVRAGGVVAYPTEGVYGLGCLPQADEAVQHILSIKQRDPAMGLILIAADSSQLEEWVASGVPTADLYSSAERPVTWIVPAAASVSTLIRGNHEGLAVRITSHPVARALCLAADSAIVSTSANVSGRPTSRNLHVLRRQFGHLVDCVVAGRCGPAGGASEIRDWRSGKVIRPATT
ncbi:MAG: L-threonylcarbamoyladenylate synthase [Gammaproteobacteria bacterium]|nr:L-threonylcarbamoyladenylate synthase [Gammaproteobacteria bacterium]MDH4315678.1 L-threonylcarbamoyladenylate synthase [Gammaproteobacteria bacterium]MDH5214752.1 L-threonylcarbamoyladenylate synthase [Gammaproteobacteria bacterium]